MQAPFEHRPFEANVHFGPAVDPAEHPKPNQELGINGRYRFDREARRFEDGRDRDKRGRFGFDQYRTFKHTPFIRYKYAFTIGNHNIGNFDFEINSSGLSFKAAIGGQEPLIELCRPHWGKNIAELGKELSPDLYESLTQSLQGMGLNPAKVSLASLYLEQPTVGAAAQVGINGIGAQAQAQVSALAIEFETDDFIFAGKLRFGIGLGRSLGQVQAKNGKPGELRRDSISIGAWEFALIAKERSTLDQKVKTFAEAQLKPVKSSPQHHAAKPAAAGAKQPTNKKHIQPSENDSAEMQDTESKITQDNLVAAVYSEAALNIHTEFADDPIVTQAYNNFKGSGCRERDFVHFMREVQTHLSNKQEIQQYINCAQQIGQFCTQVAIYTGSRKMMKIATGVNALTQTFQGVQQIKTAVEALKLGGSGGALASSVGTCFAGAGMVLGAISMISALKSSKGNNGLGEALQAIHSAVMGMWNEMRESFSITWELLEKIDQKLNLMEVNNWRRFKILREEMHEFNEEMHSRFEDSSKQLHMMLHVINDYLNEIADQNIKIKLNTLENSTKQEIAEKLNEIANTFLEWLEGAGCIAARTGRLDESAAITNQDKIKKLERALKAQHPFDIKLGLLSSLTIMISNDAHKAQRINLIPKHIIHPLSWIDILNCYLVLVNQHQTMILQKGVGKGYSRHIQRLISIVESNLELMQTIASEEVFRDLIKEYQGAYQKLRDAVTQARPVAHETLQGFQLNLAEDAKTNFERFEKYCLENPSYKAKLEESIKWNQMENVRGNKFFEDLIRIHNGINYGSHYAQTPDVIPNVGTDQLDILMQKKTSGNNVPVPATFKNAIDSVTSNLQFLFAYSFGLVKPVVAYVGRRVCDGGTCAHDWTIYYVPCLQIGDMKFPIVQGNLFCSNKATFDGKFFTYVNGTERLNAPVGFCHDSRNWYSEFILQEHFNKDCLPKLLTEFDEQILRPARHNVVSQFKSADNMQKLKERLVIAQLQLLIFVKAILPNFQADLNHSNLDQLLASLQKVGQTGERQAYEQFDHKLVVLEGNNWKQYFTDLMNAEIPADRGPADFDCKALVRVLNQHLRNHPLLEALQEALDSLRELEKQLDPKHNREFFEIQFQKILNQDKKDLDWLSNAIHSLEMALVSLKEIQAPTNDREIEQFKARLEQMKKMYNQALRKYEQLMGSPQQLPVENREPHHTYEKKGSWTPKMYQDKSTLPSIPLGLDIHKVEGDGHCLYRAVSYYLLNGEDVQDLRNRVADYLQANKDNPEVMEGIYAQMPKGQTIEEYIAAIRNSNEWADNLEIVTLMQVFKRPIVVIEAQGSIRNEVDIDIDKFSGEPIFVYYNGHNHYDALLLKKGKTSQEILQHLIQFNNHHRQNKKP